MELRFFELYRSAEYIQLLAEGAAVSFFITVSAGIFGFVLAFGLAGLRYFEVRSQICWPPPMSISFAIRR